MIARRPHGLRQHLVVVGFLAPALILLGIFVVAPVVWAVGLSFTDWRLTGPGALHPKVVGLAVPGMVTGSPGMEGGTPEHYKVLAFDAKGATTVFATH